MSRPSSSEPQICSGEGGARRAARLMRAGSVGAIHGEKTAQITKKATNTAPIAASGLRRASRGSEMAAVEMGSPSYVRQTFSPQRHRGAEKTGQNSCVSVSKLGARLWPSFGVILKNSTVISSVAGWSRSDHPAESKNL